MNHPRFLSLLALGLSLAAAIRAADATKVKFADVVHLVGDSVLHCACVSTANGTMTLKVDDGDGDSVTLELPLTAIVSIESAGPHAVQFVGSEAAVNRKAHPAVAQDDPNLTSEPRARLLPADGRKVLIEGHTTPVPILNLVAVKDAGKSLRDGSAEYSLTFSASGSDGNSSALSTTGSFAYTLRGVRKDLLDKKSITNFETKLTLDYTRNVVDGKKSDDQSSAGVDFERNAIKADSFAHGVLGENLNLLGYTRGVVGFDRVKGIRQYNVLAAGIGFVSDRGGIRLRFGPGYRFEDYLDPAKPSVSSVGLDIGFDVEKELPAVGDIKLGKIANKFKTILTAEENYHSMNTLSYEFGKKDEDKITFGPSVTWDYLRKPPVGKKKLDTKYSIDGNFKW